MSWWVAVISDKGPTLPTLLLTLCSTDMVYEQVNSAALLDCTFITWYACCSHRPDLPFIFSHADFVERWEQLSNHRHKCMQHVVQAIALALKQQNK